MTLDKSALDVTERPESDAQNGSGKPINSQSQHATPHRAVIIMSVGLLLGVLAAVGHHLWYSHWNGKVVETASWSQTWIKNLGTAFAFLVKMFLAIISSTAFIQQFWITVKRKPVALGQVDSMFTVLQSALQFLSLKVWIENPLLAFLAIVTWLLPLAAIVTPGTLNVIVIPTSLVTPFAVPQFDFVNKSVSYGSIVNDGGPQFGSSGDVQRMVLSTASGFSIGQIQFPFTNASYELAFFAPALSCSPAPNSTIATVIPWLVDVSEGAAAVTWLGFVPTQLQLVTDNSSQIVDNSVLFNGDGYNYNTPSGNQPVELFVAMNNNSEMLLSQPMVQCSLYNASYEVAFQFEYPHQNISVIQRTLHNPITSAENAPDTYKTPDWAYLNLMDAFADIMIGYSEGGGGGTETYRTMYRATALGTLELPFGNDQMISILENMFQNITLGLLSNPDFQANGTAAQLVDVTVNSNSTVYDYRSEELYAAYGASIIMVAACFVLGLISIHRNSGSYSNDFSTVLRTTRHVSLQEVVNSAESSGLSPLDKDLAEVKIVMMESNGDPDVPAGFRVTR